MYSIDLGSAILGALVAGVSTLVRDHLQNKNIERQRRQQAYSNLMGLRVLLVDLLATNLDNRVGIDYYIIRSELEKEPKDEERAYRLEERNSELQLEIARSLQKFFETLGSIINLFHIAANHQMIKELNEMIYQISRTGDDPEFQILKVDIKTIEDLKEWNDDIKKKISDNVVPKIAWPIDKFLEYLENELKNESQSCELRCCLCSVNAGLKMHNSGGMKVRMSINTCLFLSR